MKEEVLPGLDLVGECVRVNERCLYVNKLLGKGLFSSVYLVTDHADGLPHQNEANKESDTSEATRRTSSTASSQCEMVLKFNKIETRNQREAAEREANVLSQISHPSIVKLFAASYRTLPSTQLDKLSNGEAEGITPRLRHDRSQHYILTEFCEGGTARDLCTHLISAGTKLDLFSLIVPFGQICNAVSYLQSQTPPIIHRALQPSHFLIKDGDYKLCNFRSAVVGNVSLKTPGQRADAMEFINRTTTPAFRAPEMVNLEQTKRLTPSTDIWALGCCLYEFAFLHSCFPDATGKEQAVGTFEIPDDNPYGEGLVELLDRMLTVDPKERIGISDVVRCLSAIYEKKTLPPKKTRRRKKKSKEQLNGKAKGIDTDETFSDDEIAKEKSEKSHRAGQRKSERAKSSKELNGPLSGHIATIGGIEPKSIDRSALDRAFPISKNPFASAEGRNPPGFGDAGVKPVYSRQETKQDDDELQLGVDTGKSEPKLGKSVSWNKIRIREYERALGDHPCSNGPAISLGWEYNPNEIVLSVDDFEGTRPTRRAPIDMVLDRSVREEILELECDCTRADIARALRDNRKIKHQRRHTINNLGKVDKLEEAVEGAKCKIFRAFALRANKKKGIDEIDDRLKHEESKFPTVSKNESSFEGHLSLLLNREP